MDGLRWARHGMARVGWGGGAKAKARARQGQEAAARWIRWWEEEGVLEDELHGAMHGPMCVLCLLRAGRSACAASVLLLTALRARADLR